MQKLSKRLNFCNLLVLKHLNSVIPSHSTVGSSASDKDHFGLSLLRQIDGLAGIGSGGGFADGISADKSCGSSACDGKHCDCCNSSWFRRDFHFVCFWGGRLESWSLPVCSSKFDDGFFFQRKTQKKDFAGGGSCYVEKIDFVRNEWKGGENRKSLASCRFALRPAVASRTTYRSSCRNP